MKLSSPEKKFNIFLLLLILSLVGNSCADFAFIWHAVAHLPRQGDQGNLGLAQAGLLPSFYLGQAFGYILLAPVISVYADRYTKRTVSISTDFMYAVFLAGILIINKLGHLQPEVLFIFSLVTSTLGGLHKNTIGFGALKALSNKIEITNLVTKFNAAYFTVRLIGSAIAGVLYRWSGLNLCLIIAILTFLPMIFIYFQIFPKEAAPSNSINRSVLRELKEGIAFILNDKILITNSICIALWNLSANMFPGIVGIAFQRFMPGRTDLASYAVSTSILVGVLSYFPLQKVANKLSMESVIIYSLVVPAITMTTCSIFPSPLLFTLGFTLNCSGSALLNILSSGVRVKRVPDALLGRVNTAHTAIISIGQIVGSIWLLPLMANSLSFGTAVIAASLIVSSIIAFIFMPKIMLREALL